MLPASDVLGIWLRYIWQKISHPISWLIEFGCFDVTNYGEVSLTIELSLVLAYLNVI